MLFNPLSSKEAPDNIVAALSRRSISRCRLFRVEIDTLSTNGRLVLFLPDDRIFAACLISRWRPAFYIRLCEPSITAVVFADL
jgi:hypothetical protein